MPRTCSQVPWSWRSRRPASVTPAGTGVMLTMKPWNLLEYPTRLRERQRGRLGEGGCQRAGWQAGQRSAALTPLAAARMLCTAENTSPAGKLGC